MPKATFIVSAITLILLHFSFFFSICDFCEVECKSPSELEVKFAEMELEHLFKEQIQPLL